MQMKPYYTILTHLFMHFELIKVYRQAAKVEHKLSDIIFYKLWFFIEL